MNILIVSDDHGLPGFEKAFNKAQKEYGTIDMVLHGGDTEGNSLGYYTDICKCQFYAVCGNNDFNDNPECRLISAGEINIFLTHGHRFGVYAGLERLYFEAVERGADVAVFGHTHRPFFDKNDSVMLINPGSLTLPRGSRTGSFAVLSVDDESEMTVKHYSLD